MENKDILATLGENPSRRDILAHWEPENEVFWKRYGERIAKQNLYTSTFVLTLAFVAWTMWATLAPQLNSVGFHFSDNEIFTLIGLGGAVTDTSTTYDTFVLLVGILGIAGANFSSSMANIGFFFPKSEKGLALGINAGIGNLGVSVIYLTAPMLLGLSFGGFFGAPLVNAAGHEVYLQSVYYFWAIPTALSLILIWFCMDNLPIPRQSPRSMMSIFSNKHTWLLCVIYTCGFGSFIGYSAALALLVNREFPEVSFTYAAFLGPFIGAGVRPIGGWVADKVNSGSKVTLYSLILMLVACIATVMGIQSHNFPLFFGSFLVLFFSTGFINAACFRMIPFVFNNPVHSSLVTGFTAAIAAYGAFFIPKLFGWAYGTQGSVTPAFNILIAFTVLTIAITWFFYVRKGAGIKC